MISGSYKTVRPLLCSLVLAVTPAQSAGLDASSLIPRLTKPSPATIAFTEVRFSPLLQAPLVVSGELQYSGPASFDRRVARPYREETQIRGDSVRVAREGEPARSFALKRAPELRGLLTGFTGLLTGDRAVLEREFVISVAGDESAWKLLLIPADARARARLQQIEVDGRDQESRCFSMITAKDGASIILLGATAQQELPTNVSREMLEQMCEKGMGRGARGMGQNSEETEPSSRSSPGSMPRAPRP